MYKYFVFCTDDILFFVESVSNIKIDSVFVVGVVLTISNHESSVSFDTVVTSVVDVSISVYIVSVVDDRFSVDDSLVESSSTSLSVDEVSSVAEYSSVVKDSSVDSDNDSSVVDDICFIKVGDL